MILQMSHTHTHANDMQEDTLDHTQYHYDKNNKLGTHFNMHPDLWKCAIVHIVYISNFAHLGILGFAGNGK